MRTEQDVRENPMVGDVWRYCEPPWEGASPVEWAIQARVGNLVAYTNPAVGAIEWATLDLWSKGYLTATGRALHIAQPGGEA